MGLPTRLVPLIAAAWTGVAEAAPADPAALAAGPAGLAALAIFAVACVLGLGQRTLALRRSKSLLLAAGAIWALAALSWLARGDTQSAAVAARSYLGGLGDLLLVLVVVLAYVNALEERGAFAYVATKLADRGASLRGAYWLTGACAFVAAPLFGSLSTAVVLGSILLSLGNIDRRFGAAGCVHVVVAANAGGVFSPFGDLSTLVAWQRGVVPLDGMPALVLPALVAWLVPAAIVGMSVPAHAPVARPPRAALERGTLAVAGLYLATLLLAVLAHEVLGLPAAIGMLTGLGMLLSYAYDQRRREARVHADEEVDFAATALDLDRVLREDARLRRRPFDAFAELQRIDWDALLHCYGAVFCVGGLATLGYAALAGDALFGALDPALAGIVLGLAAAFVDQLVVMLAALEMSPQLAVGEWLLATLAIGLGGSLLAVGSAAGVAVMSRAGDVYTFRAHLRWSWAIALGYAAGISVSLLLLRP
jgi:Na+/H+ antiporter NhaD/arsenite permease-like protein